jgi:hypothetical protein
MTRFAISFAALALAAPAAAGVPQHPADHTHHRAIVRLCDRADFTMRGLPSGSTQVTVDEWIDGHEISAWPMSPRTTWFFGRSVSGRLTASDTTLRVQAAHFAPGCARLVVAWWRV